MTVEKKTPKKTGRPKKRTRTANTKKRQGNLVFSLDIGTRTVVGIIGSIVDETFNVIDCEICAHTKRAMKDGQIEEIEEVARVVKKVKEALETRQNVKLTSVAIAAAGRSLKTQRVKIEVDVPTSDAISSVLERSFEIEAVSNAQQQLDKHVTNADSTFYCVGHSVVEFTLDDYPMKSIIGHKGKKATIEVIAAFLPAPVVDSLYAVTERNKLNVCSLTLEPIAAMNVIIPPEIRLINIALVDIGAGTSDIAISKSGSVVAYAMATTAGDEITEEIIKTYLVDFDTAEQMKMSSETGEITYRDILGLEYSVKTADFFKSLHPAVDVLADTIAKSIIEINDHPPAAVFLVGGGSQIPDLPRFLSGKLDIPESRIAIGGNNFIKNVVMGSPQISGPEYVTPVGIAVTSTMQKGYDFSTIMLNDKKFRVFDTKNMTILDLLMLGGYKTRQIIGHNGKNLSFTLNGEAMTYKGEISSPAQLFMNGSPASLDMHITQGDHIKIIPATNGVSPSVKLSALTDDAPSGTVTLDDTQYDFGTTILVNSEPQDDDYNIKNGDVVEMTPIQTLYQLLEKIEFTKSGYRFKKGKVILNDDCILADGDNFISIKQELTPLPQAETKPVPGLNSAVPNQKEYAVPVVAPLKNTTPAIKIKLNGMSVTLPEKEDDTEHLFLEVLPIVDLDLSAPKGSITTKINGRQAQYISEIFNGDNVEVYFD